MTQDSWATAKVWCSLKRIKILKETGKEPLGQIPPSTPEPIVDMSKWTVFSLFSLLITLLILKWMTRRTAYVGAWCMHHGVENKDTEEREFRALLNTEAMDKVWQKVWQEEPLTKTSTCFKHCFHWCALTCSLMPDSSCSACTHVHMGSCPYGGIESSYRRGGVKNEVCAFHCPMPPPSHKYA